MSDIVERLRQGIKALTLNDWDFERTENDMDEAADEIERLRAALWEIAKYEIDEGCPCSACQHSALARAALGGE